MVSSPTVSVIIATYNRKELLREAIESVFQQTFTDYELIIVDHGSTDGTAEFIQTHYQNRVHYVPLPFCPLLACSKNAGIKAARGSLIAFLDDDDLWLPHKLERQVAAAKKDTRARLFYTLMERFDVEGACDIIPPARVRVSGNVFKSLIPNNPFLTSTVMVYREALDTVGHFSLLPELRTFHDFDLWSRIAYAYPVRCVPDVLARYRVHTTNTTENQVRSFDVIEEVINKHFRENRLTAAELQKAKAQIHLWRFKYALKCPVSNQAVLEHLRHTLEAAPYNLSANGFRFIAWMGGLPVLRHMSKLRHRALRKSHLLFGKRNGHE